MTVTQAYTVCRGIARREAKNFYFAFLALPAHKRNAICAVYAFMRHADDISDDESLPKSERSTRLANWMAGWHREADEGGGTDPVFVALNDARLRFRIPLVLLDQLVEGTAMDLEERAGDQTFADFEALRRYCYLVASVVGLVCIRIFQYSSPQAETLAEDLGLAFQLTNILRDVREDAERDRVYLPVDDLARHGLTPEALAAEARRGGKPAPATRAMLAEQAARAQHLYSAGKRLLPLVAPDSRPALWVLMTIYHRLLGRMERANYDVLTRRLSVPLWEKLALLARGLGGTVAARARGRAKIPAAASNTAAGARGNIAVIGAGVAGLAAGCALAGAGYRVTVFERRPYVGGRASSYLHPGSGETIDNCQHILLGCCTNLRSLLQRMGRSETIAWTNTITYIEPGGRRSVVRPRAGLPAPLHSAASFLTARCFSQADKQAIARGLRQFVNGYPADVPGGESFLTWATRHGQTPGALKRFWEPILQSALNDDLDRISMHYAGKVLRDSFMTSAEAGTIGVPLLPLSEMYSGAAAYLRQRGGEVRLRTGVEALHQAGTGWSVQTQEPSQQGAHETFDSVVLALPLEGMRKLLPTLPVGSEQAALGRALDRFEHVPLVGIHLWFDREITELPHAVLLDTTIQWMYQKEKLAPQPRDAQQGRGSHLELVISVARKLVGMPQQEIIDLAIRELGLFFPAAREATLVKAVVTKEVRATFSTTPGLDAHRPPARTAWPGLFLAGDWTDTGWPATMEGAARSGFLAAEAVTGGERFLVPDLPARGLMRLVG